MAHLVIKKFYKDKRGRLCILIEGKLTDKNFWIDEKENKYSICLEEYVIRALPFVYGRAIRPYNDNKEKQNGLMKFTKVLGKKRCFYVI